MNKGEALKKVFHSLQGNRSQRKIAKRAGLSESKVSLYANARQFPRDEGRRKLATGLGCASLEQLDRAIALMEFRPELADDPEELKAAIGLFDEGDDPERAAAALLENIKDPKLSSFLRDMSRQIDQARNVRDAMESLGDDLSVLRRSLIIHWTRVGSPEG